MAEPYLRQHALAHRGLAASGSQVEAPGVRLWLEPGCVQLALRGDGGGDFRRAVAGVIGPSPPTAANTVASDGGRRILWLGPSEWLAVCAGERDAAALVDELEQALEGMHALISDVSHGRAILGLAGERAREVLMKGCSLDLDPVAFGPASCAQTLLARTHMLLHQLDESPAYHVYIHRSFADYAFTWLEDAAREYGLAIEDAGAA